MNVQALRFLVSARTALQFLWGFGAAVALDHAFDIKFLFVPVMAGMAVVSATVLLLRKTGR